MLSGCGESVDPLPTPLAPSLEPGAIWFKGFRMLYHGWPPVTLIRSKWRLTDAEIDLCYIRGEDVIHFLSGGLTRLKFTHWISWEFPHEVIQTLFTSYCPAPVTTTVRFHFNIFPVFWVYIWDISTINSERLNLCIRRRKQSPLMRKSKPLGELHTCCAVHVPCVRPSTPTLAATVLNNVAQ